MSRSPRISLPFAVFLFSLILGLFVEVNSNNKWFRRNEIELDEYEELASLRENLYLGEILTHVNKRRAQNQLTPVIFRKRSLLHNCATGYFFRNVNVGCPKNVHLIVEKDFPPRNLPVRDWVKESNLAHFLHLRPLRDVGLSLRDNTLVVSFVAPLNGRDVKTNQKVDETDSEEEQNDDDDDDYEDQEENDLDYHYSKLATLIQARRKPQLLSKPGLLEKLADQLGADWTESEYPYVRGEDLAIKRAKDSSFHSVVHTETTQTDHEKIISNGNSKPYREKETKESIHQTEDATTDTKQVKSGKTSSVKHEVNTDTQIEKETKLNGDGETTEDINTKTNQNEKVTTDKTDNDDDDDVNDDSPRENESNTKKSIVSEREQAAGIQVTVNKRAKEVKDGGGLSGKTIVIISLSCALGLFVMIVVAALVIRSRKKARRKKHMRMMYGAPDNLEVMNREQEMQQFAPDVVDTRMGNPIFDANTPTDYKKI